MGRGKFRQTMNQIPPSDLQSLRASSDQTEAAREAAYQARLKERTGALQDRLSSLIPREAPFVWEVGCGHGHFLTAHAAAHPEQTYIGVDLVSDRIERARRKAGRARLSHLHFLNADAWEFL